MAEVAQKQLETFIDKFDYEGLYCGECDQQFKALRGMKSHVMYKHTGYKRTGGKLADRQRSEKLAELFLNNLKVGKEKKLNKAEMMLIAGYSSQSVAKNTGRAFSTATFKEALARRGVTGESIIKVAQEAQEAQQGSWHQGVYHQDEAPDHATRIKGAHLLADITGIKSKTVTSKNININVTPEEIADIFGEG